MRVTITKSKLGTIHGSRTLRKDTPLTVRREKKKERYRLNVYRQHLKVCFSSITFSRPLLFPFFPILSVWRVSSLIFCLLGRRNPDEGFPLSDAVNERRIAEN